MPVEHTLDFIPTNTQEIKEIILGLKLTSPGHDDVSIKVIKSCVHEVAPYLKHIINKSFDKGIFPKQLQIAKVIPVFKKGEKCSCSNYRPISIFTKIQ